MKRDKLGRRLHRPPLTPIIECKVLKEKEVASDVKLI